MPPKTPKNRLDAWLMAGGSLGASTRKKRSKPKLYPYLGSGAGREGVQLTAVVSIVLIFVLVGAWFNSAVQSFKDVSTGGFPTSTRVAKFTPTSAITERSAIATFTPTSLVLRVSPTLSPTARPTLPPIPSSAPTLRPTVIVAPTEVLYCGQRFVKSAIYQVHFDNPSDSALNFRGLDGGVLDLLYHGDKLTLLSDFPRCSMAGLPLVEVRSSRLGVVGWVAYSGADGDLYLVPSE